MELNSGEIGELKQNAENTHKAIFNKYMNSTEKKREISLFCSDFPYYFLWLKNILQPFYLY